MFNVTTVFLTTSCERTFAFVTTFRHKSSESARHNFTMWALSCATFSGLFWPPLEHLTSGTELILIGWKIVPDEEHVQNDHRFPHNLLQTNLCIRHNFSTQIFRKRTAQLHYVGPELRYIFWSCCGTMKKVTLTVPWGQFDPIVRNSTTFHV